jgi:hypothetical protein
VHAAGRALYIADSLKGIIWSVPLSGGSATPWPTDPALAPVPTEALPILTSADHLASPSATAVRGDRLYVTDSGVPDPHDPKPQTARINLPALLAGAAH